MNKELKLKEKLVLQVHHHAISQIEIIKKGKLVKVWQTTLGRKRPRHSTYEALIEKAYEYYYGNVDVNSVIKNGKFDFSFRNIFELAVKERIETENPEEKTISDYRYSYKAFIPESLSDKDIRSIKPSDMKKFLQQQTQELRLTKKRLYKYKGILNLVFDYACDPERMYVEINPVPKSNRAYLKNCVPENHDAKSKAFQPDEIDNIRNYIKERINDYTYDVNGFAILFASYTGVREGEIPSLKWSDISEDEIHIHSQQNDKHDPETGKKIFYYKDSTKDEKGFSRGGRYFPLTDEIRKILYLLKLKQQKLGIESEWVFCREDGSWTTTVAYYESLYRITKALGLKLSNNHAFRIALNSYVLIPMGIPVTERARLLGHSVDTNLRYYSFDKENSNKEICDLLNDFDANGLQTKISDSEYNEFSDELDFKKKWRPKKEKGFKGDNSD